MLKKMVNGVEVECSAEEEAEIRAEWAANDVKKALYEATLAYRDKREKIYPRIGDQLDAIYRGFKALKAADIAVGDDADAWLSAVDAVKATYPRPT